MALRGPVSDASQWADVEYIPMDIYTSSSIGCEEKVIGILESLPSKEILNKPNRDGWTVLMYAAYSGDPHVVKYLLEQGASHGVRDKKGQTPLMLAANCGNTDSATLLIEAGSDVNAKDNQNWTALFYAASTGHRSVVHILVEKGARVNIMEEKDGMTPLMLAAAAGHEMIVKDLLQYGASVSVSSKHGETARSLAVRNGHNKVKSAIDAYLFLQRNYSPSSDRNKDSPSKPADVKSLLESLNLSKYYPIFQSHGIDLSTFWTLTDAELKEMGIELLGPRKKIAMAISRYKGSKANSIVPPEAQLLIDKLLEERKTLQQKVQELKKVLSREESARTASEMQLAENIQMLQSFTNHVKETGEQLVQYEKCLRNMLCQLKQILPFTESLSPSTSQKQFQANVPSAGCLVEQMESIVDYMSRKTSVLLMSSCCVTSS